MSYDYDNAPRDPHHGGKLTAEMAAERIAELEAALRELITVAQVHLYEPEFAEDIAAAKAVLEKR